MNNITAELVVLIAMFLSMLAFFMNLTKKVDNVSKDLSDFKDEIRKELNNLKIENQKEHSELKEAILQVHHKHETMQIEQMQIKEQIVATQKQQTQIKEQLPALGLQTAERINQMETDNKSFIKDLFQSVENLLKRPPVL